MVSSLDNYQIEWFHSRLGAKKLTILVRLNLSDPLLSRWMTPALQSLVHLQGQHRLQVQDPKHLQAARGSDTFPSNA